MKPYILDDASAFEYKRLDLMSKILDPGHADISRGGAGLAMPSVVRYPRVQGSQQRLVRQEV